MAKSSKLPKGVYYIVGNEFAERFSYYGMKSLLVLFLANQFIIPEGNLSSEAAKAAAREETHYFIFLAYFLPIIGGVLSDWFLGKYRTILWFSLVCCLGHLLLAFSIDDHNWFLMSLTVVAIGAGVIKSSVSAHVGDQLDDSDGKGVSKAFEWFYFSINIGAALSYVVVPLVNSKWGPELGFGIPGAVMGVATIIFWLGRNQFQQLPPSGMNRENFLNISLWGLRGVLTQKGKGWLKEEFSEEKVENVKRVWKILALFSFIPFFWMAYDQHATAWVQQAQFLNLNVDLGFANFQLDPAQIPVLNPVFILILVPLFSKVVYPWFENRRGDLSPQKKMSFGFVIGLVSYVTVAIAQELIDSGDSPSVMWQFWAFLLLTISEILIYGTGLEYSYRIAPKSMKSTIMGFWLLTIAGGNLLTVLISGNIKGDGILSVFTGANYYWFITAVIAFAGLGFYFSSRSSKVL